MAAQYLKRDDERVGQEITEYVRVEHLNGAVIGR
jgi:hypothetical protein